MPFNELLLRKRIQLELFTQELMEVDDPESNKRYVICKNPMQALDSKNNYKP